MLLLLKITTTSTGEAATSATAVGADAGAVVSIEDNDENFDGWSSIFSPHDSDVEMSSQIPFRSKRDSVVFLSTLTLTSTSFFESLGLKEDTETSIPSPPYVRT